MSETSFEGSTPRPSAASPSPTMARLRLAMILVIGVYPLITGLLYAVVPLTEGWSIWQRDLIVAPLMVIIMVFGLIPFVQKRFARFISGRRQGA